MSKIYMIVTNDEFEIPVKTDVIGAKAVAEFMGIESVSYLRQMMCGRKSWGKRAYKALPMEEARLTETNSYIRRKRYDMKRDRTQYYTKRYYAKKHEIGVNENEL